MLHNIFLFKSLILKDLKDLDIFSYPNEIINIKDIILVNKIIKEHEDADAILQTNSHHFFIDEPIAQFIDDLNIYTACINGKIIIGLIFDNEDNPYDYKEIFKELLHELLNNGNGYSFNEEIEVDNLLISMFIDIRRFYDEVIERPPDFEYYFERETFFKVFLFGIDEVGKSSLVRRMKTGEFTDNFFTPTRKFNIEYIPAEESGLFAVWDMPGQKNFRKKWLKGLQDSNIIVYMIDVANQRRFEESKKELWNVIRNKELAGIPLLLLYNKIDLVINSQEIYENQSHTLENEVSQIFDLDKVNDRKWKLLFTSVKTNYNIDNIIPTILDLISS